jgi:23S rRNA (uracil1939-C5)-methyltransferase
MNSVKIDRVGDKGDGLGSVNGTQVFVAKALPGEVVEFSRGKIIRILETSPDRVIPFCEKFDTCGGCKFQHWAQEPYAAWKIERLSAALSARGIKIEISDLIDAHGEGRRRASFHVRQHEGQWVAGFMEAKSHDLVALETCPVLVPKLQNAPLVAASFGSLMGACDVSVTQADNGLDVAIKAERAAVTKRIAGLAEIMAQFNIARVSVNGEVAAQERVPVLKIGQANVQLPVQSFLQATALGEATLAGLIIAGLKKSKNIVDLFCGVGPFTFRLAQVAKIHGIDSDKAAVANLLQATRFVTGLKPITAEARDLFDNPLVPAELNEFDTVVFDPPRAGAEAQCRQLAKSKVKRVIAVACDIQSFARDAAILIQGGYRLERITPVDQFKYTSHLELVALFTRP